MSVRNILAMDKLGNAFRIYKFAFWASWAICILVACISFSSQRMIFFNGGLDFGADYFNVNRYVAEFDPYGNTINGEMEHFLLPFNYLCQYPFSLTSDYSHLTLQDCWTDFRGCILPFAIYSFAVLILFVFSIIKVANKLLVNKVWIPVIILSSIFIFSIERGNTILFAASLINLFLVYYNSSNKWERWMAVVFLAIVSVIKIVPGILCLLYLKNRNYKGLIYYGVIAGLLTILPFFCFDGGLSNILLVKERMALQIETYGAAFTPYRFGLMAIATQANLVIHAPIWHVLAKILTYFLFLGSVYLSFTAKDNFKACIYLLFIPALFSGSANVYNDLYLFPLFLYTVGGNLDLKRTKVTLILFFFIIQPIQIVLHSISLSYIIANLCSVALWIYFVLNGMIEHFQKTKETPITSFHDNSYSR